MRGADAAARRGAAQSSLLHTLDRTSLRLQPHGTPHTPKGFDEAAERDEEEIAEVEMVLEGSFLQMDNTYNKLQTLCEYIDDTEARPRARTRHPRFSVCLHMDNTSNKLQSKCTDDTEARAGPGAPPGCVTCAAASVAVPLPPAARRRRRSPQADRVCFLLQFELPCAVLGAICVRRPARVALCRMMLV